MAIPQLSETSDNEDLLNNYSTEIWSDLARQLASIRTAEREENERYISIPMHYMCFSRDNFIVNNFEEMDIEEDDEEVKSSPTKWRTCCKKVKRVFHAIWNTLCECCLFCCINVIGSAI